MGALAHMAIDAAKEAGKKGVGVTVVDPRWVKPIPLAIAQMLPRYKCVVVLEDGIRHGGIGSSISELARDANISVPIHSIGVPLEFIEHSSRSQILHDLGITATQIAQSIIEWSELTKLEKPHLSDGSVGQSQIR